MSETITAIIGSTEYDLTGWDLAELLDYDGVGMSPAHRFSERGPLQHGDSDVGFRLDPRRLSLAFAVRGTRSEMNTKRASLLDIFKPRDTAIKLRWELDNGDVRQIDCHFDGDMTMGTRTGGPNHQKVGVMLRCPDPLWYDPTPHAVLFDISAGTGAFVVPFAVPFTVGGSTLNQAQVINYAGNFRSHPIITITGPLQNALIEHETSGLKLDFTGLTIAGGASRVIDTRYGRKTVVDGDGVNAIAGLTEDSDLATFAILAAPDAPGGVNSIRVSGIGASASTRVSIVYNDYYVGF